MPPSLSSILTPELMKLFDRAKAGDPQATVELQSFQSAPELSSVAAPVNVEASAPRAGMMSPGLAGLPQDLPPAQGSPSLGAAPSFGGSAPQNFGEVGASPRRGTDWSQILGMASMGLSGLGSAVGGRVKADPGAVNQMVAQQYQQEQVDQMKRRHGMWELAFQQAQQLPPEIIADPKYASLAASQQALMRDMQDGKVDNEKSVSGFLTELARYKPELDQLSQRTKISQQVAGETQLQKAREAAGLAEPMEQKDYNFEGTPVTRTEYLKLSDIRRQKEESNQTRKDIAAENAAARRFAAAEGSANRAAMMRAQDMDRAGAAIRSGLENVTRRFNQKDPLTGEYPDQNRVRSQALATMRGQLFDAAQRIGLEIKEPTVVSSPYSIFAGQEAPGASWQVGDKTFPNTQEGRDEMLEYIANKVSNY